ncbi:unnamed protein product [Paramecium pentaurelia]|uniref:Transmembrane protein n=1 Tax=Paramecium pentaurelia TaxID=43138 RepID=A0A8S1XT33_9CILI|nr:unnamed protein product [Paramecium pentaurelia]
MLYLKTLKILGFFLQLLFQHQEQKLLLKRINISQKKCLLLLNIYKIVQQAHSCCKFKVSQTLYKSIISIQSNPLVEFNHIEQILIREVTFIGNILLKITLGIFFSLIEIYLKKTQEITMENIQYQGNIFDLYETDPIDNSASLARIESGESKIRTNNILCLTKLQQIHLIHLFPSFQMKIQLKKFQTFNHNYLDTKLWEKYYQLQIHSQFIQDQITYLIKNAYKIDTIEEALSITASQIQFKNGLFDNIIASRGLICEMS